MSLEGVLSAFNVTVGGRGNRHERPRRALPGRVSIASSALRDRHGVTVLRTAPSRRHGPLPLPPAGVVSQFGDFCACWFRAFRTRAAITWPLLFSFAAERRGSLSPDGVRTLHNSAQRDRRRVRVLMNGLHRFGFALRVAPGGSPASRPPCIRVSRKPAGARFVHFHAPPFRSPSLSRTAGSPPPWLPSLHRCGRRPSCSLAVPVNDGVRSPHRLFGMSSVTLGELRSTWKLTDAGVSSSCSATAVYLPIASGPAAVTLSCLRARSAGG